MTEQINCYTWCPEASHSQNSLFVFVQTGSDSCAGRLVLAPAATKWVESTEPFKLKVDFLKVLNLWFALKRKSTGDSSVPINICLSSLPDLTLPILSTVFIMLESSKRVVCSAVTFSHCFFKWLFHHILPSRGGKLFTLCMVPMQLIPPDCSQSLRFG